MAEKKEAIPLPCGPYCSIASLSSAPDRCVSFCLAQRCPELISQLLRLADQHPSGSFFLSQRPDVPLELHQIVVFCTEQKVSGLPEIWKLGVSLRGRPTFEFWKAGRKIVEREVKDVSDLLPVSNEICKSFDLIPRGKGVDLTFRLYLDSATTGALTKTDRAGQLWYKTASMGTVLTLKNVTIVAVSGRSVVIERTFAVSPS
jgi:hypothetical protein